MSIAKIIAAEAIPILLLTLVYLYRLPIIVFIFDRMFLRNPDGSRYVPQPRKSYGSDER
jgi:hypothetical protein